MNDKVKVTLTSGNGGNGAIAFRHEKSVDKGGPFGGNGGKGGSISLRADTSTDTLASYRFGKVIKAEDGENGKTKLQYGKDGKDIVLPVPCGTVIEDEKGNVLADLVKEGDTYLAVKGGRGGRGNAMFKSPSRRLPNIAENGFPGESKVFYFELKLLADVGLLGYPNVGKSSFLAMSTRAHPEIADYEFTTIEPMVGVCILRADQRFVLADIPGLIEGASEGRGQGFTFLRHIERCRVLLHILDVTRDADLKEQFDHINHEVFTYSPLLKERRMVIGLNKIDQDYDREKMEAFKNEMKDKFEIFEFSALTGQGMKPLLRRLYTLVEQEKKKKTISLNSSLPQNGEEKVYSAMEKDNGKMPVFKIVRRNDGSYEIIGDRVVRTKRIINLKTDEGMDKLLSYLDRIGVDKKLKEMKVENGATIVLDDFEFEYFE